MSPTKQENNRFSYWFDIGIKGLITVLLIIVGSMTQREFAQRDESQKNVSAQYELARKEINELNVKVATLETKLDFIINHMEYAQKDKSR